MSTPSRSLPADHARKLLDLAGESRVLVVGDCMLDRYVVGDVERISPEAPVPVVRVQEQRSALGGAANVAAGVVALGGACRVVGVRGDDAPGERLRELLEELSIGCEGLVRVQGGRPTTLKTRILARHQQMLRVDRESTDPVPERAARALREEALEALGWANALVLEDYDKGVISRTLVRELLERARDLDVPSVVDPKLRHFFDYGGAFLFKPNGRELAAAEGRESPPRSRERLAALRDRLGVRNLLVTMGGEGMLLLDEDDRRTELPARPVEVYDVSGAGDTVTAVLAAVLSGEAGVLEAARLANEAAGIEVSRLGAVPVSRADLLERFGDGPTEPERSERTRPRT